MRASFLFALLAICVYAEDTANQLNSNPLATMFGGGFPGQPPKGSTASPSTQTPKPTTASPTTQRPQGTPASPNVPPTQPGGGSQNGQPQSNYNGGWSQMPATVRVAAVQAESKWLNLTAGVNQVVQLVGQASAGGAKLVGFPETFIPGYPWWIWTGTPAAGMAFVPSYAANCMTREGPEMDKIRAAARQGKIFVVLGFCEREGGSLYMAQALIDDTGSVVYVRRKLKPTHVERSVFGEGDGSDFRVSQTKLGRIGSLNCWEHLQPLSKYAMYSMGEQIHVGSWPSFSVYRGAATALGPEVNTAASLIYAVEGQTFVVAPCAVVGAAAQKLFCDTDEKRQLLKLGGGFARIYGPEGTPLATPLSETAEGILYADLNPALIDVAKSAADPVGHYSRPDVLRLLFNPQANPRVEIENRPQSPANNFQSLNPVE